jgi:uncharacterized membrane protein
MLIGFADPLLLFLGVVVTSPLSLAMAFRLPLLWAFALASVAGAGAIGLASIHFDLAADRSALMGYLGGQAGGLIVTLLAFLGLSEYRRAMLQAEERYIEHMKTISIDDPLLLGLSLLPPFLFILLRYGLWNTWRWQRRAR